MRAANGRRDRQVRQARSALLVGLVLLGVAQVGLLAVQKRYPFTLDPEPGYRLAHLRQQRAERPNQPLVLMLGSSRVRNGFRLEGAPPCRLADGREAMLYNFGLTAMGPANQLLFLHRLVRQGLRPDWLFLEYYPPMQSAHQSEPEANQMQLCRLEWEDLPMMSRYRDEGQLIYRRWLRTRLVPWFNSRAVLINEYLPWWLPYRRRWYDSWLPADRSGWSPYVENTNEAEHRDRLGRLQATARNHYWPGGHTEPSPRGRQAQREILELCSREKISVVIVLLPEGPVLRDLYPPGVMDEARTYLAQLRRDFGVHVVDVRDWMSEEDFTDSIHLTPASSAVFTNRFVREVLQPLLLGKPAVPSPSEPLPASPVGPSFQVPSG
jgi:hypothetical protein